MFGQGLLLIVGNGLSMDMRDHFHERLSEWDTSCPLSWDLMHPELGRPLADLFPEAFAVLQHEDSRSSDFDRMTRLVESEGTLRGHAVVELRHYLVMAFSMYQRVVDGLPLENWRWFRFMQENMHRISGIVSLNYDLVAERIANRAGIKLLTCGPQFMPSLAFDPVRKHTTIMWKPHGSIDYRPSHNSIVMKTTYPLPNWAYDNNLPLEWCPRPEWTMPRIEADVVVPTEASRYREFQWVVPGERWVRSEGARWNVCVIVGMSYANCDREEIDIILCSLPPSAKVFVVDPKPSADLRRRLDGLGLEVTCLPEPPTLVQRSGALYLK